VTTEAEKVWAVLSIPRMQRFLFTSLSFGREPLRR